MPVHDWTRVSAGTFHDFHSSWLPELKGRLNDGLLPAAYYAQVEQVAGEVVADVLTLEADGPDGGGTAVAIAPPRARHRATLEVDVHARRARRIAVRHASGDRVVALIEVVSPGNKSSRVALRQFVAKSVDCLTGGYHLTLVDLFPPTPRDPDGIHAAIWGELGGEPYSPPAEKPLTVASYASGPVVTAYVDPVAVGDALPAASLFLTPETYVGLPLEESYAAAYRGVPRRWRDVIEGARAPNQ